jgi:multiple sugar transport system permease protein
LKINKNLLRDLRNGLLFTSPYLVGLIFFTVYPIGASFYYSFCEYTGIKNPQWIGLENYTTLFNDPLFRVSLYNTVYYTMFAVPLGMITALALAVLLNNQVKGLSIFRTIFYLPSIVPVVASSVLWLWLLNPQYGLINSILDFFHIRGPGWLSDPVWAKPSLILMSLWSVGGTMIIYLAALQDVPQDLLEAAELDGASSWQKIRNITLPMISPAILFTLVTGLIGSFQYFTQAYVMTAGGPVNATHFYSLYLFRNAFSYFKMGYASAQAWILFVIVLVCTVIVFKTSARWIYYGGER